MTNKTTVLFDMDGTLTPPREKADGAIIQSLLKLSAYTNIGILTGSDFNYILQQLPQLSNLANLAQNKVDLLPCNGTKRYAFIKNRGFEQTSSVSMTNEIGKSLYNKILKTCCALQLKIMNDYPDLPYTGTFMQYRGSLLNWCPIGRESGMYERKEWEDLDSKERIRDHYQKLLQKNIDDKSGNVTVTLGGSTSFDIYPGGWDKTYGLMYYRDQDVYFIGDRCQPGGNDWHIYEKLKKIDRAYETVGPEYTLQIIDRIIAKLSKA